MNAAWSHRIEYNMSLAARGSAIHRTFHPHAAGQYNRREKEKVMDWSERNGGLRKREDVKILAIE